MTTSETKNPSDSAENKCLSVSIADIMSKEVITVSEDCNVEDVIELFEKNEISLHDHVPIMKVLPKEIITSLPHKFLIFFN